jgi:hypothetical protein
MIDDQGLHNEPDAPPLTKINPLATARLNETLEWTPLGACDSMT